MLVVTVLGEENFDQETQEFTYPYSFELEFEHSLVSLSKWESKYEKPFLDKTEKTSEEVLVYIDAMLLTENPPEDWLNKLDAKNVEDISKYIDRKMTATWFNEYKPEARSSEQLTSELIYYWMTAANIDWEAQYWHLNRLFTLIKIAGLKNAGPKKMGKNEAALRQRELNAQRRAQLGTSG